MGHKKRSLLWRLEGEILEVPSFVFGTMHVRDQLAFGALDTLYRCIDTCEALATEFRLEDMGNPGGMMQLMQQSTQSLDQYYRPKVYQKMRRILRKTLGLELNQLKHLPPFFVLNIINEQLMAKDMPLSLDEQLSAYAAAQDKTLLGVETFAEQIAILEKIPVEEQLKSLRAMLTQFARHRRQLKSIGDLYATGDAIKIYKATRKGAGGLRKLLLFDRNRIMADRIYDICQSQATFIAIGAGHLAGAKGVLRYLKQKGLRLTPISIGSKEVVKN